jgi:hypothetical protein
MVRVLRFLSILASTATVFIAVTTTVLASRTALEEDDTRSRALLSVRGALHCTVERDGVLPRDLRADALPGLCRTLAGPQALAIAEAQTRLGYLRLSPTRYRLCAAFNGPVERLAWRGPRLDRLGCIEETVTPPSAQSQTPGSPFRIWKPRRRV